VHNSGGNDGGVSDARARKRLPRNVWILGFVSLLMDLSSEIYHALLPLFITVTLGLPVVVMGAIDGIAEATASFAKLASGRMSDRSRRRKPLILVGYGLAALSKPLFPLASGAAEVMGAKFADRLGKGIRGAPRDGLIADETPPEMWARLTGAIAGFEMEVLAWRPTVKLSQKKTAAERETIAAGLETSGAPALAQLMRTLAA